MREENRDLIGRGPDPGERASNADAAPQSNPDAGAGFPVVVASAPAAETGAMAPAPATRRLAVNALAGTGTNAVKIVIQLVMLPLMAHLLGPAEFGIYALALPTVAFFMTLADGGLGASLARDRTNAAEVWSTAFWLVLMVGAGLALLVAGWGVILARLSHEAGVRDVMALLSLTFLCLAACVLPSARLTQQGRLVVISVADLASAIVGAAVAVGLALAGYGAMSLAAQYVAAYLVRALILNLAAFVRPAWIFRFAALKEHISTGSALVCVRLADFSGRLLENLIFGRTFGSASLGTFTFANQVPRFLCEAASGPLWAALYAHSLHDAEGRIASLHVKLVRLLALLLAPLAFLLSAAVPGIITLILGPAWHEAADLLRILIPFYALGVIAGQSGAILMAKGFGWTLFWITIPVVVGRVAAVGLGPWIGPTGIAWAFGAIQVVYTALMFRAPARLGQSQALPLVRALISPTLAGMAAGVACAIVVHPHPDGILRIAVGLSCGIVTYGLILLLVEGKRLRQDIEAVIRLLRR